MNYGRLATRLLTGLMFLVIGINKLTAPQETAGFLDQLGFPIATTLAWVLIIVEVIGGAMLLTGFKVEYAAAPLFIVLLVATIIVHLGVPAPVGEFFGAFTQSTVWLHLIGMAILYDFAANKTDQFAVSA